MANSVGVKYTIDNPRGIPPQPGLEIVVELSQFLGFTQGGGDPPVFGGAPILKSLIKNRERATNPISSVFLNLDPSITYWISGHASDWGAGFEVNFSDSQPFTIADGHATSLNLTGVLVQEPH